MRSPMFVGILVGAGGLYLFNKFVKNIPGKPA